MIWMGAASAPSCGFGGIRGRQRSAIPPAAWDGSSRRAAHAWPRLGVQYERDICECVRRAAASRRTASARFGLTIRDSSSPVEWPSESGGCAADSPRRSHASASLQNARGCDDVAATRSGVSRTPRERCASGWVRSVCQKATREAHKGAQLPSQHSSARIATSRLERLPFPSPSPLRRTIKLTNNNR